MNPEQIQQIEQEAEKLFPTLHESNVTGNKTNYHKRELWIMGALSQLKSDEQKNKRIAELEDGLKEILEEIPANPKLPLTLLIRDKINLLSQSVK